MALNILKKLFGKRGEGLGEMLTWLTKGGTGVGQMLTLADKGGMGGLDPRHFWLI